MSVAGTREKDVIPKEEAFTDPTLAYDNCRKGRGLNEKAQMAHLRGLAACGRKINRMKRSTIGSCFVQKPTV
jgi:hypothetical protein